MVRIVGIDPGYDRAGVAVVETSKGDTALLFSTCITSSRADTQPQRLHAIVENVEKVVREWNVREMALELLYFGKNQKTAMGVAEVRGALKEIALKRGLTIAEYTPSQVKVALTGSGSADKRQLMRMVNLLMKLPPKKRLDDEYGAIAVAITHAASRR